MSAALRQSYAECVTIARHEAKNFYYAFWTLPRNRRHAMCALYAFMRRSDDIGDGPGTIPEKQQRLAAWRASFHRALAGHADDPILPAVRHTIQSFGIPPAYCDAVLDGVAMDLEPVHYASFAELSQYCYRVASAVGLCCIRIWGFRGGATAEVLAEDCGIALQLTNIIRDLTEDARMGRVYLPAEDLQRFGVSASDLAAGRLDERTRGLLGFEVERARDYYRRCEPLMDFVAPCGRPVLRTIIDIYRGILDEIERRRFDVFSRRVGLSRWRKAAIALKALPHRFGGVRREEAVDSLRVGL